MSPVRGGPLPERHWRLSVPAVPKRNEHAARGRRLQSVPAWLQRRCRTAVRAVLAGPLPGASKLHTNSSRSRLSIDETCVRGQDRAGAGSCTPCGAGYYNGATGSVSATACQCLQRRAPCAWDPEVIGSAQGPRESPHEKRARALVLRRHALPEHTLGRSAPPPRKTALHAGPATSAHHRAQPQYLRAWRAPRARTARDPVHSRSRSARPALKASSGTRPSAPVLIRQASDVFSSS